MADLRPQYNEYAVGANHPTKADVINRAWDVEHNEDGTHGTILGDLIVYGQFSVGASPVSTVPLSVSKDLNAQVMLYLDNKGNATPYGMAIVFSAKSPDNQTQYFMQGSDSTAIEFNIWSDGSFVQASDARTKVNITDAGNWLSKIMNLPIKEYEKANDESGRLHIGIIANEITKDFGHLVNVVNKKTDIDYNKMKLEDQYMLDYIGFVPIALKSIQELRAEKNAEIEELTRRIKLLEVA